MRHLKPTESISASSKEQLRVLAETVPQFVWATQPDGYLEYWNQRYIDYLQISPESLRGYGWRQFLHPDDLERVVTTRTRSLETGEPYEIEYRLRDGRTGTYRWFLSRGAPVRNEAGKIVRWFGTCTDIEDQKHTEEALRQSQERVQALMESSIIGIVVADGETIVEANDAFFQMTGYCREEVQSRLLSFPKITLPEYAARDQQTWAEIAVSRPVKPYETAYICKDGRELPILAGGVALAGHASQTIGFVLDNSARHELERRKDDFISMASHELKTPLTSLKLQTQLLRRQLAKQGNTRSTDVLARMEEQVNHLERLVGELLDVSKIQSGRLEYLQEIVDLDALLHAVAEIMQQVSATHTFVVRGTLDVPLSGDKSRLEQVFINLLSNAIKYSPAGSTVEVDMSQGAETVTVSVRDHGMGIPQEQREKIFERFYRAFDSAQKTIPGLGMGLYIVEGIVKSHGGTITVDSALGKGSTFQVTLPLKGIASHP